MAMQLDRKRKIERHLYTSQYPCASRASSPKRSPYTERFWSLSEKFNGENSPVLIWPLNEFGVTLIAQRGSERC